MPTKIPCSFPSLNSELPSKLGMWKMSVWLKIHESYCPGAVSLNLLMKTEPFELLTFTFILELSIVFILEKQFFFLCSLSGLILRVCVYVNTYIFNILRVKILRYIISTDTKKKSLSSSPMLSLLFKQFKISSSINTICCDGLYNDLYNEYCLIIGKFFFQIPK